MRIVFIGDIVGKPGRRAVKELLPALRERHGGFDLVIANAENAAGGNGITAAIASELTDAGIDLMTMGNHVWDQKEFPDQIADLPNVIRPANLPKGTPGRGWAVTETGAGVPVAVLNMGGSLFFNQYHNPFEAAEDIIPKLRESANVVVLDFHAEATSEKIAMGRFLDGKASLVVGTHTHVQTADETVFPGGTAYITDVGMTGPHDSVIGVETESVIRKFLTQMPARFETAKGDIRLCAVCVDIDEATGRARSIERLCEPLAT